MLLELDGLSDCGTPGKPAECVVRKYTWGLDLAGQNGQMNSREAGGGIGGLLAIEQAAVGGGSTQGGLDAVDLVVLGDGNGNVTQLVAWASGYGGAVGFGWHTDRLAAHYEYTPYGGTVNDPANAAASGAYAAENPWRFSTKQWDDEHGTPVGYWGYRYYDPAIGRWLNRDPIGVDGGINLYAYVHNDPILRVDPRGLSEPGWCGGIGTTRYGPPFGCKGAVEDFTSYEGRYRYECYQKLIPLCDKYDCCNGPPCVSEAKRLCRAYVSHFISWRRTKRGHYSCIQLSQVIQGFDLSGECLKAEIAQNKSRLPNCVPFGDRRHQFVAIFHVCNTSSKADAILDPWDFLDGTFPCYDPETHGGKTVHRDYPWWKCRTQ